VSQEISSKAGQLRQCEFDERWACQDEIYTRFPCKHCRKLPHLCDLTIYEAARLQIKRYLITHRWVKPVECANLSLVQRNLKSHTNLPPAHAHRQRAGSGFPILKDSAAYDVNVVAIVRRSRRRNQCWRNTKENQMFRDYDSDIAVVVYIDESSFRERRV